MDNFKVRTAAPDKTQEARYKKLTQKQRIVYYYLISICYWDGFNKEQHYYVYKNNLNISQASRVLGIGRSTFHKAIDVLKSKKILIEFKEYYHMEIPRIYSVIGQETLSFLLSYQACIDIDLIRVYIALSRMLSVNHGKPVSFTKRDLVILLGHHENATCSYQMIDLCLAILKYWDLIDITWQTKNCEVGTYRDFLLKGINEIKESSTINTEMIVSSCKKEIFEKVKEELSKDPFWNID